MQYFREIQKQAAATTWHSSFHWVCLPVRHTFLSHIQQWEGTEFNLLDYLIKFY